MQPADSTYVSFPPALSSSAVNASLSRRSLHRAQFGSSSEHNHGKSWSTHEFFIVPLPSWRFKSQLRNDINARRIISKSWSPIETASRERIENRRRQSRPDISVKNFRFPHDRGNLFHGGGRSIRPRRSRRKDRVPGDLADPRGYAVAVEFAHGHDGQRAGDGDSRRGWLLHLGAAGHGALLGISGNVADAGRQRI